MVVMEEVVNGGSAGRGSMVPGGPGMHLPPHTRASAAPNRPWFGPERCWPRRLHTTTAPGLGGRFPRRRQHFNMDYTRHVSPPV